MNKLLAKLNKLANWQVAVGMLVVGLVVFFDGLKNQFLGDDLTQIVTNPVVHSLTNIRLFFDGGTFYVGKGLAPLFGVYFRPLMTTTFSIIYTLFGLHPFYFHLIQLLLCVGSSFFLYLLFKHFLKPALALLLALIFLVHPANSQVVYAIPYIQDALFFFFGILGLYLLVQFKSTRSLILVGLCLLLSLLAKETGLLFVAISLLYLFWWDRKRLLRFGEVMILPLLLWLVLKTNAVGLLGTNPHNAPIDNLSLFGRLMTSPEIVLFYISKFIFPWRLSSAYYFVHPTYSSAHFLLPLLADLGVASAAVFVGFKIKQKASKKLFLSYLFFAIWMALGLLMILQIIPLDMTVCETWFYFPVAGILGMIGVAVSALSLPKFINRQLLIGLGLIIFLLLGVRSALRGPDWSSAYALAAADITASPTNYVADNNLAWQQIQQDDISLANQYAEASVNIFPSATAYSFLGLTLEVKGDYPAAINAYSKFFYYDGGSLDFWKSASIYENMGCMELVSEPTSKSIQLLKSFIIQEPKDSTLWSYLAIAEFAGGNDAAAKAAIQTAVKYGPVQVPVYEGILDNQPFKANLNLIGKTVNVE